MGDNVFDLSQDALQTLVYLSLAVGGIVTLFSARTRGPFWSVRPGLITVVATVGAALVATLFAVYGVLMSPISWGLAGIVWGYCWGLILVQDPIKLIAYRIFGKEHSGILVKEANARSYK